MPDITKDEMRLLLREQAELFANFSRAGGNAGAGGASGMLSAFNSVPLVSGMVNTSTAFTSSASDLIKGNAGLQGALDITRNVLLKFGPPGQFLAGTFLKIVETGYQLNEGLKKTGESGLFFNNNIFQLAKSINQTQMSFDQFMVFMPKNAMAIAGMGESANKAGIAFTKAAADMLKTDTGQVLLKTGVGAEFLNQTLANVANVMQYTNMNDANARKKLIDFSVALSDRFDDLSRLTGIQKAQLQEQVNKQLNQAQITAYFASLDVDEKKRFIAGMAEASKRGPEFAQAFAETQAFGNVMTEQSRGIVAAMGPAQESFYDFNAAVKEGGNVAAASNRLDAQMAQLQQNENYQRSVMLGGFGVATDSFFKGAVALQSGNAMLKREYEAYAIMQREGFTRSYDEILAEIDARAKTEKVDVLTDPASQLSVAFNTASQTIATAGIAATEGLERLNAQLQSTAISDFFQNLDNNIKQAFDADKISAEIGKAFSDLKRVEVTPNAVENARRAGVPIPGSVTIDMPNQNRSSSQPTTNTNQNQSPAPPPAPPAPPAIRSDDNSVLDTANQHLSTISNYMRTMTDYLEKQMGYFRDLNSRLSNNRGAP